MALAPGQVHHGGHLLNHREIRRYTWRQPVRIFAIIQNRRAALIVRRIGHTIVVIVQAVVALAFEQRRFQIETRHIFSAHRLIKQVHLVHFTD